MNKSIYKSKLTSDWFDPDIVVISDDIYGTNSRGFWVEYDECHFSDGEIKTK